MTHDEHRRKSSWLRKVLADAKEHGDYHLEMDVIEKLTELQDTFNQGDEMNTTPSQNNSISC
jgi:hypothetical protein